jgi:hypothetical protein
MTPSELTAGVMVRSAVVLAVLAAGAGALGGRTAACGLLAGGALALGNFRWLASTALAVSAADGPVRGARWLPWAGLRLAALLTGAAAVLLSGWAHPVAVVAGLTVVPGALVAAGLRGGRQDPRG